MTNIHLVRPKLAALFFIVASLTGSIALAQPPVANFTANPIAGCSPLIVNFQDQSTGGATSWSWNFGNGNTSTLQNPTASYFNPGTYTVTLTATNANGSNTMTRTDLITVYESPVVSFTGTPLSGCFPLRVQFTDMSTGGNGNTNTSWQWDFGNGITSTLQHPLNTYSTAGMFTVTLRVTNDKGCSKTFTRTNYVNATPGVDASFTHTPPNACKAPATVNFTNTSTGPATLSYYWDFGDGFTSTAASPVHTYNTNGSFVATLVTTSTAGCVDTARSNPIVIGGYTNSFSAPLNACVNEPVSFINTTMPAPVGSYWTFGDGGTVSASNATYTYTNPGTYNVWLYNNFPGCSDSVMQTITISPRPGADFSAPVTTACQPPLTVNFQDMSSGGATGWQWDFGDGNTSALQNPSHTYTAFGNYTVTLIVTNPGGCYDTIVKPGFVKIQRASLSIPVLPVKGCIPYTIAMTPVINSMDPVASYEWDFGDGGTSTAANPTYTYTIQGTYTVRLIIVTNSGCRDTLIVSDAVKVGSKPVSNFIAAPIPVCGRQMVSFTDLSAPADEWLWEFGDGSSSTLQNPTHQYNDTGYFDVTLIAYNNGCPDTLIRNQYTHVLPPIARFTPAASCTNRLQFSFTDQSVAPQTWAWDFGDGATSTMQNPVHTYSAYGPYNVRLIVTHGACADTLVQTVFAVNENPNIVADRTTACKQADINFNAANVMISNIASYYWDFGDGNTQTTSTPSATNTYVNPGIYSVTLITTDINGCRDSVTRTNYIRVNGPAAGFNATNVNGCTGLTTTFNDLSTTDGTNAIANWEWNFGDGTVQQFSAPPFQHIYNIADTFTVQLIVTDAAGCRDSVAIPDLVITTDPSPDFVTADTLTCPGATVSFTNNSAPLGLSTYWEFGDGNSSTNSDPTHAYAATGLYNIKLRIADGNGCIDSLIRTAYVRVDKPSANFTINDSISACIPFEIQFTNTSTYFSSTLWDFGPGQGTSTLTNPVHYYSIPGTYPVKLIVTSPGGCLDSMIRTIRVFDTTGSGVDYLPLDGCSPLPVTLNTFTTAPMNSYFWDFGDGHTMTTTTPNVSHVYSSFGNFLPKVIMEDPAGCIIPLPGMDTIYITGARAKFGLDDSLFCDFGTVNFSDSSMFNDPITSYNWSFGDGGSSSQQHPVHNYTTPGIYTVRLALQTQIGCRDTLTKPLLVKVVQSPVTNIIGDTIICINKSLQHSGIFVQPDTSIVSWYWTFPNGNHSTSQNPVAQTYKTAGTFSVTSIATNSTGCKDTTVRTIHVKPLPVVTLPGQMTVQNGFPVTIPATYSPNTVSWVWSPSAGLSCANCPTPEAGPKLNTRYQVYFTDDNGCSNIGAVDMIVICKNSNLFIPNTFSPNGDGSNDVFYARGKGLERIRLLRIFNRWGEIVFEKRDFPVNDASVGWDGSFKGKKPVADVYVYQAEVFCDNGDIIRLNGNIALIL